MLVCPRNDSTLKGVMVLENAGQLLSMFGVLSGGSQDDDGNVTSINHTSSSNPHHIIDSL